MKSPKKVLGSVGWVAGMALALATPGAFAQAGAAAPPPPPTTTATTGTATTGTATTAGNNATMATDTGNADAARALFEQGVAAYSDGRYADALVKFEESRRVRRTAAVAMNMGITLRALGRLVEARDNFREFFELSNDRQRATYEAEIRAYLTEIARRVGTVHVASASPSAYVMRVDERLVHVDGQGNFDVDPGNHRAYVEADGYGPQSIPLSITEAGKQEITVALQRTGVDNRHTVTQGGGVSGGAIAGIIIAVVALGAGGAVLGYVLTQPSPPPPNNSMLTIDVSGH